MDRDSNGGRSEYKSIAAQFAAAKTAAAAAKKTNVTRMETPPPKESPVDPQEQQKRARFVSLHWAALGFFSWIL